METKDKFMLTIKEAAPYFSIGQKKLRRMAEENKGDFALYAGNRYLIIRSKLEEYFLNGGCFDYPEEELDEPEGWEE